MQREWAVWVGFMAVVIVAVMFVLGRDDSGNRSQVSAGTSMPTTTMAPVPTTATTLPPTTTSSSSSTTAPTATTPTTTGQVTTATTEDTTPAPTTTPTTPAATAPPTVPPASRIQFGPGGYRIGIDLPAGTYRTDGGPSCYWARLSSFDGSAGSVIAGQHTNGSAATVTILSSDAGFSTDGCAVWLSV